MDFCEQNLIICSNLQIFELQFKREEGELESKDNKNSTVANVCSMAWQ